LIITARLQQLWRNCSSLSGGFKMQQNGWSKRDWHLTIRICGSKATKTDRVRPETCDHMANNHVPLEASVLNPQRNFISQSSINKLSIALPLSRPQIQKQKSKEIFAGRSIRRQFLLTVHPVLGGLVMERSPMRVLQRGIVQALVNSCFELITGQQPGGCYYASSSHQYVNAFVQAHCSVQRHYQTAESHQNRGRYSQRSSTSVARKSSRRGLICRLRQAHVLTTIRSRTAVAARKYSWSAFNVHNQSLFAGSHLPLSPNTKERKPAKLPIGKLLTIKNFPTTMKQSTNPRNKQNRNNNNKRDYDTLYLSPVSLLHQDSKSPTKTTKKERKRRGV
jgi:hypothetical protein